MRSYERTEETFAAVSPPKLTPLTQQASQTRATETRDCNNPGLVNFFPVYNYTLCQGGGSVDDHQGPNVKYLGVLLGPPQVDECFSVGPHICAPLDARFLATLSAAIGQYGAKVGDTCKCMHAYKVHCKRSLTFWGVIELF